MNPALQNTLAVLAGIIVGSLVNMGLIMVSGFIIPPPPGGDITTMEGLASTMPLFEPKHFIFPFFAHALGTFVGAMIAARLAANRKIKMAFIIGFYFLLGGITMIILYPSPIWFTVVDLVFAYIPMAWLGGNLITKRPTAKVL